MPVAVVRPLQKADTAEAVSLLRAGSVATLLGKQNTPENEDESRLEEYWDAALETRARGGDVLVAVHEDDVVGVVQVLIFRHFQHTGGWCCEIESVHVRADQRSRGVGAQLLAAAEELARARGCYRIQLTSNNVREDAHRFYAREGYTPSHRGFKKSLS
jgi:GNAT superfamily N-acetyltransferase